MSKEITEPKNSEENTPIVDEIPPIAPNVEEPKRYYYKAKNGKGFLNFKSPLSSIELENYEEITKEEFERLTYVEPHVPTKEEKEKAAKHARIVELKSKLASTDYVALKLAEGETTKEEYADVFANRKAWREEINQIESELASEVE